MSHWSICQGVMRKVDDVGRRWQLRRVRGARGNCQSWRQKIGWPLHASAHRPQTQSLQSFELHSRSAPLPHASPTFAISRDLLTAACGMDSNLLGFIPSCDMHAEVGGRLQGCDGQGEGRGCAIGRPACCWHRAACELQFLLLWSCAVHHVIAHAL